MADLLGKSFKQIIGKKCYAIMHGAKEPVVKCPFLHMKHTRRRETTILRMKDRWFNVTVDPLLNDEGGISGAVHIMSDISGYKRAEEALRAEKIYLEQLFETAQEAIIMADNSGKVIKANPEFLRLFAYDLDEMIGRPVDELIVPKDLRAEAAAITKSVAQGKKVTLETTRQDKNKKTLYVSLMASPIVVGTNQVAVYSIYRDITARRRAEDELKDNLLKLQRTMEGTVFAIAKMVEARDPYTAGHQQRVADLAVTIARKMNLGKDLITGLRMAATIHDIGKIYVPAEILSRPAKLSSIEFAFIKKHPELGSKILQTIDFPWPVADIVLQHHERLNGTGYPNALKSNEILLEAKILAVADVVEAMCSHRPYRPARSLVMTLDEIAENCGTLYDPEIVKICRKLFKGNKFAFETLESTIF
jgi:PAS domain S-box-containing protein/putative nucleotidyltransferase with HDIG domain